MLLKYLQETEEIDQETDLQEKSKHHNLSIITNYVRDSIEPREIVNFLWTIQHIPNTWKFMLFD